jgi:hypothetical protein
LFNGELHNLQSSPNITRMIKPGRMRWAEYAARLGVECIQDFIGIRDEKRRLGRFIRGWRGNIKINHREIE